VTERRPRSRLAAGLPAAALLVFLGVAFFLPSIELAPANGPAGNAGAELQAAIAAVPQGAAVLVDLDADLGTYPEIRYAARAALAELLRRNLPIAVVSFSPEGRAIAVAEVERLRALGAGPDRLIDLGFRSGGEPALVQLAGNGIGPDVSGPLADTIRGRGGLAAFGLAVVIGGGEIGPRGWVEQVQPRLPKLPIAAITPTFLLPEVQPYRGSGQLVALVGTLPGGIAYGDQVAAEGLGSGPGAFTERVPNGAAIVFGMLVAIGMLLASSAGTVVAGGRALWRRTRT
jgi:hypothetical protein